MKIEKIVSDFRHQYETRPRVFRAPGRVNLIGEHTDYNDGFVMPFAIDFATYVAASARTDRKIVVHSNNLDDKFEFDLDQKEIENKPNWAKYIIGVAFALEEAGHELIGANLLIDSEIPIGAGLSSSAALEVSIGFALCSLAEIDIEKLELAKIGQIAENKYVGLKSGLMDQFASAFGIEECAIFLDCRSLEFSPVSLSSAQFVICNTKIKHDLAEGEYNKRRQECEDAANFFGCRSLRDVSLENLQSRSEEMPLTLFKRANHIISENQRVLDSFKALKTNDLRALGVLMNKSHASMREDFEISCFELDLMVEIASKQNNVLGSRMTGGGFGGCTINLLENENDLRSFIDSVFREYVEKTNIEPEIYVCRAEKGVSET